MTATPRKMHNATLPDGAKVSYPAYDVNSRIDEWVEAFDGHYRLLLTIAQIDELQKKLGCSLFQLYGRVMRGRYDADGETVAFAVEGEASPADLWETVRLALIGGGMAVVNGQQIRVDAALANRLVQNYLHPAPVTDAWNLAVVVLDARIHGRRARPEEQGSRDPVIPRDALPAGSVDAHMAKAAAGSGEAA